MISIGMKMRPIMCIPIDLHIQDLQSIRIGMGYHMVK